MDNKKLVVNFYGAPGAGKSTMALNFQKHLNQVLNYEATLIREFATRLIQQGRFDKLKDQVYVSENQAKLIEKALKFYSNLAVSDSPVDLGKIYNSDPRTADEVNEIIEDCKAGYVEIPVFISHDDSSLNNFSQEGRVHSKEQSIEIQKNLLDQFSDKEFVFVSRDISMKDLFEKISQTTAWQEAQIQDNGLKVEEKKFFSGVFEFEKHGDNHLEEFLQFLSGTPVTEQDIWEEMILVNDYKDIDMNQIYNKVLFEKIDTQINKIFDFNYWIDVKYNIEEPSVLYIGDEVINTKEDFKNALLGILNEYNNDKNIAFAEKLIGNNEQSFAVRYNSIVEYLNTKFGTNLDVIKDKTQNLDYQNSMKP